MESAACTPMKTAKRNIMGKNNPLVLIMGLDQGLEASSDPTRVVAATRRMLSFAARLRYGIMGIVKGLPKISTEKINGEIEAENVHASADPPVKVHQGLFDRAT